MHFAVIYKSSLLFHRVCSEDNVTLVDANKGKCSKKKLLTAERGKVVLDRELAD